MTKTTKQILAAVFALLFVVLIVLLKTVNVAPIGPQNSQVGLAAVNGFFKELIGTSDLFYSASEILGLLPLAVAAAFVCYGAYQLISRKSLKKIDKDIYVLAGLYIVTVIFYIGFEKIIINYRPVLEDGMLAASFPSSHTLLSLTMLISGAMLLKSRIKNPRLYKAANVCLWTVAILIVLLRLLSGVHWFTDILGGVFLSVALLLTFSFIKD